MNRSDIRKIGGSDIAAILGQSQWKSTHSLYLHLIGELTPQADNEILERGRKLEPVVASIFAANHDEFKVVEHGIIEDPNYPFLIGSPDRLLFCGNTTSGLEIKTADISTMSRWGEEGTDEVPVEYWIQCQWYAGLLGFDDWHLAVGFVKPGSRKIVGYRKYYIEFDPAWFAEAKQKAIDFWNNHVVAKIPPEITVADNVTVEYYKHRYPQHSSDKWAYSNETIDHLAWEYVELVGIIKKREQEAETMKVKLIAAIGENEGIKTALGNFTYRTTKPSKKTDWQGISRLLGATDETIENFTIESPGYRRFLIPKS
jgi:putative phage-type endonuclease